MMLDGPELPPILRTMGVPWIMQMRMMIPSVVCGLSMGTAAAKLVDGNFGWLTFALLAVSLAGWFVAKHERESYFAKRMAAIEAVFAELERRYRERT